MSTHAPNHRAVSLHQAAQSSDVLLHLGRRVALSQQYWQAVVHILPPALRTSVQAGAIDEQSWCLLCRNVAVATKLRHLSSSIEQQMVVANLPVLTIRIKTLSHER